MTRPPRQTVCHRAAAPSGVVLVITLLSIVLLGGLLVFVLNLGHQTNARMTTQHAADASAAAGAGWMARSFNTVAMNNTGMSQLIAGINVIDSMPLAVDFSIKDDSELILGDETAIWLAVVHQLKIGPNEAVWQRELERTRDIIGEPETTEPDTDEKVLKELNDWFKGNPEIVMNATHYQAPNGDLGSMWKALYALDEYSQTVMENLGPLTQLNAIRGGEVNLTEDEDRSSAFMLPVAPEIPWVRRQFNDFERPVKHGLLPSDIDDRVYRRGPYDAVFGWRSSTRPSSGGAYVGDPPGYRPPTTNTASRYSVYGVHEALRRMFGNTVYGRLPYHLREVSDIKLSYLWPKRDDSTDDTLKYKNEPNWEIDIESDNERSAYGKLSGFEGGDPDDERLMLDRAKNEVPLSDGDPDKKVNRTVYEFVSRQRSAISGTLYLTLDLYHREQNDPFDPSTQYGKSANPTWWMRWGRIREQYINRRGSFQQPTRYRIRGGKPIQAVDQDNNPVPPLVDQSYAPFDEWNQITSGRYAYKTVAEKWTNPNVKYDRYRAGGFPELGIQPIQVGVDSYGEPVYKSQQYWRTRFVLLVGINVGLDRVVRDPYTGFNPNSVTAPAPIDFDHAQIPPLDEDAKRRHLTVLSIAQRDDQPLTWKKRFQGGKPYPFNVAIAQAQIFNNHSWDLWTQMWHAQLEPVTEFDDWVAQMQRDVGRVGNVPWIDATEFEELKVYFENIEPLADITLSH